MSLDITKVAGQIGAMAAGLKQGAAEKRAHLDAAAKTISTADGAVLSEKVRLSKTSFLLAAPTGNLNERYPAPPPPADYSVVAADGSHIDLDRHQAAACRLINIGTVRLDYGAIPDAALDSRPRLLADDADLYIQDPDGPRATPLTGALLGIKRDVEEFQALAELSAALPPEHPALALSDGSLIRWSLTTANYEAYVLRELLENGYVKCLDEFQRRCNERELAVASYISRPGGEEVVNTLRLAVCPYEPANCDRHCGQLKNGARPCDTLSGVSDAELFERFLETGQRSAVFESTSKVIGQYYGGHRIGFFYLKLEDEVARVELPLWLAELPGRLDLLHTLVLEQARKGQGYPVALAEAHEQAVVTGADRAVFYEVIDVYLREEGLNETVSAKSFSKQARWL
ncbi:MAG: DNA double-strand break repair nuclease NurA [Dehalogenimonas sp.]|uniref:DNA double-strand break repair nuclease NurA n=1 Tax=Candidatus Dehalogenimonas loeffleri TaxID=3127115 RepID=A0ABZ2J9Y5_9CHLR|nr:DNA double-strand break repair nuclease NurA [Dehalogenimonas sp.]